MPKLELPLATHMSKEPRLAGKVALISGASRGFGQAIAVRFVEEGCKVAMLSRSNCDETMNLIKSIQGLHNPSEVAVWIKGDLGSEEDCNKAVQDTVKAFGDVIHILINNAAYFVFHSVEHASAADWDQSAAINIRGHALLTKAALPHMKKANGASIVFQGSISSFLAQPNCATYR
jgi:3-oxoacyl-[acyl-carrier protein] reductase